MTTYNVKKKSLRIWSYLFKRQIIITNNRQIIFSLTHSFPMHLFSTPWKHQKTVRFSDVFRRYRKGTLGINGLEDWSFQRRSQDLHKHLRRSSRSQMFFKKDVFKNFEIFTGKHLCWNLYFPLFWNFAHPPIKPLVYCTL